MLYARVVVDRSAPAPINTPPVTRLNILALPLANNQLDDLAPRYAYISNHDNSITAKVVANTTNCGNSAAVGSINCGKRAVKNKIALGLLAPTINPLK